MAAAARTELLAFPTKVDRWLAVLLGASFASGLAVSPKDRERFLLELQKRVPALGRQGERLVRSP